MSKKARIIITGGAFCLILAALFIIPLINKAPASLSADEVTAFRKQYPIYSGDSDMASLRHPLLEEYMSDCDTFVYGEVVEGPLYSEKQLSLGDSKPEMGFNGTSTVKYFIYRISVLDDSKQALKKGEIIEIRQNTIFEQNYPQLKKGMKIGLGVACSNEETEFPRYGYMVDGMFYVTDDGYAISVFSEENQKARSGLHIKNLLREFS